MSGMGETHIHEYTTHLASTFNISLWTLVIPLLTAILIAKGIPSLVTLFASSIMCAICTVILQPDILHTIAGDHNDLSLLKGIIIMFSQSTSLETGSKAVNDLVSTGGMSGMLNTIWLIICAMIFGAVMVASKMLQSITMTILQFVKNTVGLVSSTIGTGLLMNIATGDQFLSIIITANMYKDAYKNMGLEKRLLSRTTEDGVTVTSVLIPWNTCGLTQSTVLGVSTLTYLPFCFFNYISPLMSIIVASFGWKIYHTNKKMTKKDDVLQSF
jgi:NhaC family Na+:H+ antiporter